jgi:hypothetical protein
MKKFLTNLLLMFIMGLGLTGPTMIGAVLVWQKHQENLLVVPKVEPDHELLLLAETPEGARVYRVYGPKAVVPFVFVVSKTGSVAVR